MSQKRVLALFLFLVLLLNLFIISAQTADNPAAGIAGNTNGIVDESGLHTNNLNGSMFTPYKSQAELRIEWLNEKLKILSPVLHYTIGSSVFEFSWVFALTFFIWIFFVSSFYTIITGFSTFSKFASGAVSVILGIVLANIGVIKLTVNAVSYLLNVWWTWLIALVLLIILIVVEVKIRKMTKKTRENQKKFQEELDKERLHNEAETFGKAAEGFKNAGEGI